MKHQKQWNSFFALEKNVPYTSHLQYTKELSQICWASSAVKPQTSSVFGTRVKKQFRFMAWKLWFFQGIILADLCAVFFCLFENDYPNWFTAALTAGLTANRLPNPIETISRTAAVRRAMFFHTGTALLRSHAKGSASIPETWRL